MVTGSHVLKYKVPSFSERDDPNSIHTARLKYITASLERSTQRVQLTMIWQLPLQQQQQEMAELKRLLAQQMAEQQRLTAENAQKERLTAQSARAREASIELASQERGRTAAALADANVSEARREMQGAQLIGIRNSTTTNPSSPRWLQLRHLRQRPERLAVSQGWRRD